MAIGMLMVAAALVAGPPPEPGPGAALVALLEDDAQEREEERRAREEERLAREEEQKEREEERRTREEEAYERGTEALDEGAWDEAERAFDEVARTDRRRADAALYWKAYAAAKRGQRAEALAILEQLRSAHPQSRWLKEAKALELEVRQQSGQPTNPESVADEDLKLMALNGLLHTDPERALPMLEKFLEGQQSRKLQDRALFVLSQSGSPKAREIVERIARGESRPDLQRKAINYLGLFGGKESRQALVQIYAASTDVSVKKAVLRAFMVSGEKDRVLEAARSEKDPALRRSAIQTLGVMGARAELWTMYQGEPSREVKEAVLQALAVGGDIDRIVELAKTEKDAELRLAAIRKLGPFGGRNAGGSLAEIYEAESDRRVREAVLQALFVSGNARALIDVARGEKDPELRKKAVAHLSNMGSKEATDFLLEILEK
jgi:hypothetical protein